MSTQQNVDIKNVDGTKCRQADCRKATSRRRIAQKSIKREENIRRNATSLSGEHTLNIYHSVQTEITSNLGFAS
jgi:hypothetical protein